MRDGWMWEREPGSGLLFLKPANGFSARCERIESENLAPKVDIFSTDFLALS